MTAQLLMNAGLNLGDELLAANESNPYGHFEDTEVIRFHDKLLKSRGLNWQVSRPFLPYVGGADWDWLNSYVVRRNKSALWGFKDPRLCLFVPLWKRALPRARFLFVYRPVEECLYSLKRRSARELMKDRGGTAVHLRFWQDLNRAAAVYRCYLRMFMKSASLFPGDVAFVSRDALIEGFDLPRALNRLWGMQLEPASIDDVFDGSVTDLGAGRTFLLDEGLFSEIEAFENEIRPWLLENKT